MRTSGSDNIKRVTIMGLGLFGGGVGVAEYWARKGAKVLVTDLRDRETLQQSIDLLDKFDIEYILGQHRKEDFTQCDLLVVNPAVKPDNKYVNLTIDSGIPITTEIGIFISEHQKTGKNPTIAITGSNGKSTTTSLLSSIIIDQNPDALSGGNIGGSLLSQLNCYPPHTPVVLELSSFQLHYLSRDLFTPEISIITNLAPNHLDWHGTIENYYADKRHILSNQIKSSFTILNYQDPILREWADTAVPEVIFTSTNDSGKTNSAFIRNGEFIIRHRDSEHLLAKLSSLQLPGKHNQENAIQALSAAFLYNKYINKNLDESIFDSGLSKFAGLTHRQEVVTEIDGVLFVNDSIATTPESTIAALNSYGDREIILIAGGYDKKIPMENMCEEIIKKAKAVILIGQTATPIYDIIKKASPTYDAVVIEEDFNEAVRAAFHKTSKGIVLMSPGCASYGMFTNFQDRGVQFKEATELLSKTL